ncbi:hypothetical protein JI435_421860 [Parastagonospora nodorum SN15]|nr:hypothetical protein JI435_421860 [Parastagonospora nodorum SN15]
MAPMSATTEGTATWSPNAWNWGVYSEQAAPQSVLSFTDESLTSGEEFSANSCDFNTTPESERLYPGIMIPNMGTPHGLGGLDGNFGL